jgi:hypothetical protein
MAERPRRGSRSDGDKDDELPMVRSCGTMEVHERLLRSDPTYLAARNDSENRAFAYGQRPDILGRTGVTVIPVVVHVVYKGAAQNISDDQIHSQIDVLNRDFRKTNPDVSSTPAPFLPLAADARIEFELAGTDPAGNPTDGIIRTSTTVSGFTDDNKVKHNSSGGADAWPRDSYLNLWVCRLSGTLLGYAQFPGGPPDTDGVVIRDTAFGTTGTAAAPFNLGRTATHEIGHWLNLRHIWGDDGTGCSGDDFVADTPNAAGSNTGVPSFPHVTCSNGPNGDMFMNYMDYTDDAGMFMFTAGQVTRMQASLDGDRPTLGHVKPGPGTNAVLDTAIAVDLSGGGTLKFREDNPTTLKFGDDGPTAITADIGGGGTLKFREDNPTTLKFGDDGPTAIRADIGGGGTLKFREDNPPPTLKFRDDAGGGGTLKFAEDPVQTAPGADVGPGGFPPGGPGDPAPFILSTGHHSMSWARSFPEAYQAAVAGLQQQIGEYEQILQEGAQAEQSGGLTPEDAAALQQIGQEYERLVTELREMGG